MPLHGEWYVLEKESNMNIRKHTAMAIFAALLATNSAP